MLNTGLVSVTFRKLSTDEIIDIVKEAQLDGIEWGGDIHVPHGDIIKASNVYKHCKEEGIAVAAYGSYLRLGGVGSQNAFESVLETASALNTQTVRVWSGNVDSQNANNHYKAQIIEETHLLCEKALAYHLDIAFEFHGGTLTDNAFTTLELLKAVDMPNLKTYWQVLECTAEDKQLESLILLMPYLSNIHVYHQIFYNRFPLNEAGNLWKDYLKKAGTLSGNHFAMLEFVKNDSVEQFLEDSRLLREMCKV